ncbi:hypothetical protein NQ317_003887 [Molorchus minor]|uniref:Uncharacterized protein n=1 Tax=Molorchus minor TaxID=1323400 RepID=A0ABQ9IRR9_9CUCU|nr:hypothetical protein NQ317_003887 [Molorchus minor]
MNSRFCGKMHNRNFLQRQQHIEHYNKNMGAVDTVDQDIEPNLCARQEDIGVSVISWSPGMSSRASYGDDAISYVHLKRDSKLCTVKCKICPEHKVHAKLYGCTLVLDKEDDVILSVLCQDCAASQSGCKLAIAFLMWVHRRSEEPSCTFGGVLLEKKQNFLESVVVQGQSHIESKVICFVEVFGRGREEKS